MRWSVPCVSIPLLFISLFIPSIPAAEVPGSKYKGPKTVQKGQDFTVTCQLGIGEPAHWTKDGKNLTKATIGEYQVEESIRNNSLESTLLILEADHRHTGKYQCSKLHTAEQHHSLKITDEITHRDTSFLEVSHEPIEHLYTLTRNLTLFCPLAVGSKDQAKWYKDNQEVSKVASLTGRYTVTNDTFHIDKTVDNDFGLYSCTSAAAPDQRVEYMAKGRQHAKLPEDTSVVEGQELRITCIVHGKPYPDVIWTYLPANDTNSNNSVVYDVDVEGARVRLNRSRDDDARNSQLVIKKAIKEDAGNYTCIAGTARASTILRVKDMYAAVWPFLGIVAEVLILCIIILVYEKRRTKPELDDSDADTHDQKKS